MRLFGVAERGIQLDNVRMAQTTIAIVADCDDTLAPDTTAQLLELCGVDGPGFFREHANPRVKEGWDPSLAYMRGMIDLARNEGPLASLTQTRIRELARQLEFYPGVPECFTRIKEDVERDARFRAAGVRVETHVISGGIAELLRASALADAVPYIWGCDFAYDADGVIAFPKNVISFTDKTRYLYMIQKGKAGPAFEGEPYAVNAPMTAEERPVPFSHMVYLGDGPSDIPCMSLLQSNGGYVIGVMSEARPTKAWALGHGRRANLTVPPDFSAGGLAYNHIHETVRQTAQQIVERAGRIGPVPRH